MNLRIANIAVRISSRLGNLLKSLRLLTHFGTSMSGNIIDWI